MLKLSTPSRGSDSDSGSGSGTALSSEPYFRNQMKDFGAEHSREHGAVISSDLQDNNCHVCHDYPVIVTNNLITNNKKLQL